MKLIFFSFLYELFSSFEQKKIEMTLIFSFCFKFNFTFSFSFPQHSVPSLHFSLFFLNLPSLLKLGRVGEKGEENKKTNNWKLIFFAFENQKTETLIWNIRKENILFWFKIFHSKISSENLSLIFQSSLFNFLSSLSMSNPSKCELVQRCLPSICRPSGTGARGGCELFHSYQ